MKSGLFSVVAITSLIFAGNALAGDLPAAAIGKCGACHAVDKKGVGPSYMAIADKYKGDADAAKKIAENTIKGGALGWKMGAMPPKGLGATDAEITSIAEYIAGLAK